MNINQKNILKTGLLMAAFVGLLTSCEYPYTSSSVDSSDSVVDSSGTSSSETSTDSSSSSESSSTSVDLSEEESSLSSEAVKIVFSGTSTATISSNNGYVTTSGAYVYITGAGTYEFSGTATNMQVQVNAADAEVTLLLNGVNLTSTKNSPLYIKNVDEVDLYLMSGTTNTFKDATSYTYEDAANEEPNATICSKDDMNIEGAGTLVVTGRFNNGIHSSNDLRIKEKDGAIPTITVTAVNNAFKGKDSVQIETGVISLTTSQGDGIQADTEDDTAKGYVLVSGGTLTINSARDGIQGYRYVRIDDGTLSIKTYTGTPSTISSSGLSFAESYKALKSDLSVIINGGTIGINAYEDGIHSDGTIAINGGTLTISAGDDGVHAENTLTVNSGTITVTKAYEGLEATTVNMVGGNTHVTTADDGLNAAGGDGSSTGWGSSSTGTLNISGGYLYVNATGDGLDSNGNIFITGGTSIVNGPTSDGNGPLDCGDSGNYISQTGGTLIATGSSGMAVGPTSGSQYSALIKHSSAVASSSQYVVVNASGTPIVTFKPAKNSYSIVVSTSLFSATAYKLYSGGTLANPTSTTDGYSLGGTYTTGTQLASWTFSSSNIHYSTGSSGGGGGRP
jgi:hypothetical protein